MNQYEFDRCIIGAELVRFSVGNVLKKKPSVCTILSTADYLKLPNKQRKLSYKWLRLKGLH